MSSGEVLLGSLVTTVFHPFGFARVLIQVGHEPLVPRNTTTLFGKETLQYPNIFKYLGHIRTIDGFTGLYRGLGPRLCAGFIGNTVTGQILKLYKEKYENTAEEKKPDDAECILSQEMRKFLKKTCVETVARCSGVIASHPFNVIMIRSMVQFIGREDAYNGIFSSFKEIYNNDGILGFFAGLVPRLIAEALAVWLANIVAHLFNTYLVEDKEFKQYTGTVCGMLVTQVTYPFSVVSTCMAVSDSNLGNTRHYDSWMKCFRDLCREGGLKRGSSMFWRYYHGPTTYSHGKLIPLAQ